MRAFQNKNKRSQGIPVDGGPLIVIAQGEKKKTKKNIIYIKAGLPYKGVRNNGVPL